MASVLAALALAAAVPAPSVAAASGAAAPAEPTTTIELRVLGCDGCRIQAVQNIDGTLPYTSRSKRVRERHVRFVVPTARTERMAFVVFAPCDEVARSGFPMVVIVGFRDKQPGERVSAAYAGGVHRGSGCWAGTTQSLVRNTLVVTRETIREPALGPGRFTAAAGHLRVTLPARAIYANRRASEMHVEDPSICR
jgi:hypothetical protein